MLRQVFQRYAHMHAALTKPGFALVDHSGEMIGHVDALRLRQGRFEVEGWVDATQVILLRGEDRTACVPDLHRRDVKQAKGSRVGSTPGFQLSLPSGEAGCFLVCKRGSTEHVFPLQFFSRQMMRRAWWKVSIPLAYVCFRAAPAAMRWRLQQRLKDRAAIKNILQLGQSISHQELQPHLFASDANEVSAPSKELTSQRVTIILPVFNALDLLPETLRRVTENTDLSFDLLIIEDCSTDPKVRPFLHNWVDQHAADENFKVTLLENETNLGFIGSVNRGFEQAKHLRQHVVLLNSDAFLPPNWASRLIRPLLEHHKIASVTPMSNDAEIFNSPVVCRPLSLQAGEADRLDAVAAQFVPNAVLADAPTGVGFCMAMHKDALRAVPRFDRTFDPGYGEEVDWCQSVARKGWRHLGHGGIFVEHRSGTSFGSEKKAALIAKHGKIVSKRYPDFDASVQRFIENEPLLTPRLALALSWAGKTTLLKMIAGTMNPTSGRIIRHGSVSWPVGFAGSFHGDLTGAQNTRFVARIYGVDTDELQDFVQNFSELGAQFHHPFRSYSSGMKSRLAFGVSMGIRFDTYLVDEVTSVGDAAFREKSARVFSDRMKQSGAIMVSHGLGQLRALCDAGAVLEGGRLRFFEHVDDAITHHLANLGTQVQPMTPAK